jgi:hypothetical protein
MILTFSFPGRLIRAVSSRNSLTEGVVNRPILNTFPFALDSMIPSSTLTLNCDLVSSYSPSLKPKSVENQLRCMCELTKVIIRNSLTLIHFKNLFFFCLLHGSDKTPMLTLTPSSSLTRRRHQQNFCCVVVFRLVDVLLSFMLLL